MVPPFDRFARCYDACMTCGRFYHDEQILDALMLSGDERIVDIGGGTGHYAIAFANHCRQVTVLDESQDMLAKVPPHEKIRVARGDALQTGLEAESFDLALLSDVVHHIAAQDRLLDEAYRLLKPGGRLVIHDFAANSRRVRFFGHLERLFLGPVSYCTLDEMATLCAQHHLVPLSSIDMHWYYLLIATKS